MADVMSKTGFPRAGFRRRFAVMVYDLLVAAAIILFTVFVAVVFVGVLQFFGFFVDQDSSDVLAQAGVFYQAYVFTPLTLFYIWFWSNGGQTVGMKAWRLRIQNENGHDISKKQAVIRLATSFLGLGNLAVLFDRKNKLALQDRAAKCEVVQLTKEANQHKNWQKLY
ncbi:RDD family protein [Catenovulum sp. SM1970]|uniref:RDD family protein n=1 Tax=Marinifaba aquimaris TaxID=2741323 RepID=UPI001574BF84|nr:RDD family protein [Marinifaba aquimaris]NTS76695.1 RDD family protein [Marinifaba aquimaris]